MQKRGLKVVGYHFEGPNFEKTEKKCLSFKEKIVFLHLESGKLPLLVGDFLNF